MAYLVILIISSALIVFCLIKYRGLRVNYEENYLFNIIDINYIEIRDIFLRYKFTKNCAYETQSNMSLLIDEFLLKHNYRPNYISKHRLYDFINSCVTALYHLNDELKFDPKSIPDNGRDFEFWVAENLSKFGWDAKVTSRGADQGVDIIAKIQNVSVAVQCKLYSSNVGNRSVQEVCAGRAYYSLDRAVVISNSPYTKSARDLAERNGVVLLSHLDIPVLSKILGVAS